MNIPVDRFLNGMHKWQKRIFQLFDSQSHRFYMLNWHRRARKSTLAINLLIRECNRYPKSVYCYIAPTYKQAKNIIWDDPNMLSAYLPEGLGSKSEQNLQVKFPNGSILRILGGDDPDKLRGIDAWGIVFDEWSVFRHAKTIWQEIFRPILTQNKNRWAMFIFTPKGIGSYCYEMWIGKQEEFYKETLKASESDIIDPIELDKARKDMLPVIFNQEMECSWLTDEDFTLITSKMIEDLKKYNVIPVNTKKFISIDPATGGDKCSIGVFLNTKIIEKLDLYERDTMKITGQVALLCKKHNINQVVIDCIGVGKGIADRLSELGFKVYYINSSEKAIDIKAFANFKAEMWFKVSDRVRIKKDVVYPDSTELHRQLVAVKYKMVSSEGKIIIEPKVKTKEILGCSPDDADMWVMGIFAEDTLIVPERTKRDYYSEEEEDNESQFAGAY